MIKVHIGSDLGYGLTEYLNEHGWNLYQNQGGEFICEGSGDDPQSLVDNYNPWPLEKSLKLIEINEWLESKSRLLNKDVPEIEQKSWNTQVSEAFGLMPLNLLVSLASERGITTEELIERVKKNHHDYYDAYGKFQGHRDNLKKLINGFPDSGSLHLLPELWAIKCMD